MSIYGNQKYLGLGSLTAEEKIYETYDLFCIWFVLNIHALCKRALKCPNFAFSNITFHAVHPTGLAKS